MSKPEIPAGYTLATFRPIWMAVTTRQKMTEGTQYGLWRLVDDKITATTPNHDRRATKKVNPTFDQDVLVKKFTEALYVYLASFYPTEEEQKRYLKEMADWVKTFRERGKPPAKVIDLKIPPKHHQDQA